MPEKLKSLRIPYTEWKKLKQASLDEDKTITEIVMNLIRDYIR